jgi:hypothetical protein
VNDDLDCDLAATRRAVRLWGLVLGAAAIVLLLLMAGAVVWLWLAVEQWV